MTQKKQEFSSRNEGEGSRTAARNYDREQEAFAKSGKVKPAADKAAKALDSGESEELQRAEEKGRGHARS